MTTSAQSFSKNQSSGTFKLSLASISSLPSTYQTRIIQMLKSLVRSRKWFGGMAVFTSILTLDQMILWYFWTRYDFLLLPVTVGIFLWTTFQFLLAVALTIGTKESNSTGSPPASK